MGSPGDLGAEAWDSHSPLLLLPSRVLSTTCSKPVVVRIHQDTVCGKNEWALDWSPLFSSLILLKIDFISGSQFPLPRLL